MSTQPIAAPRRLSPADLDAKCQRIQVLEAEADCLREELLSQVQAHGFIPPKAEKTKRLEGKEWKLTVSASSTVEINDAEVGRIRDACSPSLFGQLFQSVVKYKLVKSATLLLAATLPEDAPRNLRMMFAKAVAVKEGSPRLRIELIKEAEA